MLLSNWYANRKKQYIQDAVEAATQRAVETAIQKAREEGYKKGKEEGYKHAYATEQTEVETPTEMPVSEKVLESIVEILARLQADQKSSEQARKEGYEEGYKRAYAAFHTENDPGAAIIKASADPFSTRFHTFMPDIDVIHTSPGHPYLHLLNAYHHYAYFMSESPDPSGELIQYPADFLKEVQNPSKLLTERQFLRAVAAKIKSQESEDE